MAKDCLSELSTREEQIAELIVRGLSKPKIASTLFISENTVKFHCRNIYKKLNINNKIELINAINLKTTRKGR